MASPAVDSTVGTTIAFGTTSFSAQVTAIDWTGVERPSLNTSHFGTTAVQSGDWNNATFVLGKIVDGGEITLTLHYNPDTAPPFGAVPETITITTKSGATLVFSGGLVGGGVSMPLDGIMEQTVVIKVCGPVTRTAAS